MHKIARIGRTGTYRTRVAWLWLVKKREWPGDNLLRTSIGQLTSPPGCCFRQTSSVTHPTAPQKLKHAPQPLFISIRMAQPQTPAQRLIAQYERLSTPPPPDKSTYHRQYCRAEKKAAPGIASSAKDRSPIRQSLRNLLSVFKKARKTDAPSSSGHSPEAVISQQTGSLLYLSSPGWTNCSVTLDARKLILSFTDLSVHEIALSDCTDIRSLSSSQLDHIPHGDNVKVFEVLFLGKTRERFAARSVRERAGWISAIWFVCHYSFLLSLFNNPQGRCFTSPRKGRCT